MLTGYYEIPLVLISVVVAVFASYTALTLAGRVTHSQGRAAHLWITGGAIAMGLGIWSMHFVGMLAFRLPIAVGYDFWITLLSLLLPIAVSGLALWQVSQPELPWKRLLSGALLMGLGINTMHYTGMAAMRMSPGILYEPRLFAASVAIAIFASGAALWIAFRLRQNAPHVWIPRAGAAIVMGFAIAGMHYTGMAAANFPAGSICLAADTGVSQDGLAVLVIIATVSVLTVALLISVYDARLESRTHILAASQAIAEERQVLLTRERMARAHAERVSEMKDEFLATLSHELRTPLNSILGWAQLLRRGHKDEATLQKGLDTIERNAMAQAQLIDDLLDMSRIISGKVRLEVQAFDPAVCIDTAMETVRPAAVAKNIRLEKTFDTAGHITGDPNRMQQIMWNLLSNAVKFTPVGGTVQVSVEKREQEIVISVADSGIGISSEFLPHVFDRFRQADSSTTRRYSGLGLGLSIVKQLVELHGGTILASSQGEGKGAVFTVRLPLYGIQTTEAQRASMQAKSLLARTADDTCADLSGLKVLVVDDQADALELMRHILIGCKAQVVTADNALAALELVERELPDVIVSDLGMPDVDGFELIRRVRTLGQAGGGHVPALALSAFTRMEDQKRALQAGFTRYMSKPVDPGELIKNIADMAGERMKL